MIVIKILNDSKHCCPVVQDINEICSQISCVMFWKGRLAADRCRQGELSRAGELRARLGQGELGWLNASENVSQGGYHCFL